MAYIDFPTAMMVTITGAWLDPERERPIIERCRRVAPLLDDIAKAHEQLVVFQNKGKGQSPEVIALQAKTTHLDELHDRLARGVSHLMNALAEICRGYEVEDFYSQIASELFPTGLTITNQSYFAQAGDASLREARLSDASKRVLEATVIRTPHGEASLRELVERWGKVAEELGEAEAEKVRLRAGHAVEGSSGPARRAWVKIVSLFVQALELETGLSDEERRAILQPLQEADARAVRKRAAARKGERFDPDAEEEGEGSGEETGETSGG